MNMRIFYVPEKFDFDALFNKKKPVDVLDVEENDYSESESESDEEIIHSFPLASSLEQVVRQSEDDLTCGMRCLQNIYGKHIVNRQEMDEHAKKLEKNSFGIKMYDEKLGFYSAEVLEEVLKSKGKYVQRVDIHKIPSDYYHSIFMLNPTFSGYIVALGDDDLKHYIAIRFSKNKFRRIDSLPGVRPVDISVETLLKKRSDNFVYCSMDEQDQNKVVAVIAVAGTPFLEYNLMHDTWPKRDIPSVQKFVNSIQFVLNGNNERIKKASTKSEILRWHGKWKQNRLFPNEKIISFLKQNVMELISNERSIVVQHQNKQTIVRCSSIKELIQELLEMNWLTLDNDFYFQQKGAVVTDKEGNEMDLSSDGSFDDFNFETNTPLKLVIDSEMSSQAQIGGFYTFKCEISGTCIGQQHNAYSIRDRDGRVHIVYKKTIETFK